MNAYAYPITAPVAVSATWSKRQMRNTTNDVCMHTPTYSHGGMISWLQSQFPQSMNYQVEAVTGIPASTVQGWVVREYKPSLQHFMRMLCVFGPSFAKAACAMKLDWLETADKQHKLNETEAQIARLERERERLTT